MPCTGRHFKAITLFRWMPYSSAAFRADAISHLYRLRTACLELNITGHWCRRSLSQFLMKDADDISGFDWQLRQGVSMALSDDMKGGASHVRLRRAAQVTAVIISECKFIGTYYWWFWKPTRRHINFISPQSPPSHRRTFSHAASFYWRYEAPFIVDRIFDLWLLRVIAGIFRLCRAFHRRENYYHVTNSGQAGRARLSASALQESRCFLLADGEN